MKKLLLLFLCLAISGAFGQSTLTVNKTTGAILGPVPAATFKTNNSISATNANTTGSAASLSISAQTGLLSFTGLASTNRIKTVRDAADTVLELGGSYTPTGTWTNMTLVNPALGTPASGVGTNLTGTASGLTAGHATDAASVQQSGGTGLISFAGMVNTARVKTVRDAADTILELGGSYTPTGTWTNMTFVNPALGTPASGVGTNLTGTGASFTAGHATAWTTGRTIATTGDVTYTSGSLDGTANVTGTATVANVPAAATHAVDNTTVPTDTGGWTEFFVTTSDFTTTNTTATDVTGMVTGTLTNNVKYEVEVDAILLNAADTTGMKVAMNAAGGGTVVLSLSGVGNSTSTTAAVSLAISANSTLSAAIVTYSGGLGVVYLRGFITTSTTGTATISFQTAKVTSNTATVKVGSVMRIRKAHT